MFSCSPSEIQIKINELKEHLLDGTEHFPYNLEYEKFGLKKVKTKTKTLWEDFLDQINQKRHLIAHGNVFDNVDNITELEANRLKIQLIQFALITILSSKLSK